MAHNRYEYLKNPVVLNYISQLHQRTEWVRITILDKEDLPITNIEGRATGGSITINGASSVRRSGSLTLITKIDDTIGVIHQVTNIQSLISINKRVQVEIGLKNTGRDYLDFDIFWMPLGTFFISNPSVTYNNSGITVSLKLNDKMVLLNGEEGGTFHSPVTFSPILVEDEFDKDGNSIKKPVKFRDLIKSLIVDLGEIPEWQVIIDDVPDQIEQVMTWTPTEKVIRTQEKSIKDIEGYVDNSFIDKDDNNEELSKYFPVAGTFTKDFLDFFTKEDHLYKFKFIFKSEGEEESSEEYNIVKIENGIIYFDLPSQYYHYVDPETGLEEPNKDGYGKYREADIVVIYNSIEDPVFIWKQDKEGKKFTDKYAIGLDQELAKSETEEEDYINKIMAIYKPGDLIGYTTADFVISNKELVGQTGETVASILEKIKNMLGNYEYFFDLDGVFHFQQIKNYLNEGSIEDDWISAIKEKYFLKTREDKIVYSFENSDLISAYSNSPQYSLIKNDYSVWGETNEGATLIQYRLILDKIPIANKKANPKVYSYWVLEPNPYSWEDITSLEKITSAQQIFELSEILPPNWNFEAYDIHTHMFLTAFAKTNKNQLDLEILERLPEIFEFYKDPKNFNDRIRIKEDLSMEDLTYFFDVININELTDEDETSDSLYFPDLVSFAISDIGKRTKALSDKNINCIFNIEKAPQVLFYENREDIIYSSFNFFPISQIESINKVNDDGKYIPIQKEEEEQLEEYEKVDFLKNISLPQNKNSAYEALRMVLHESLSYNNNITIQAMPVYHLDVNQRITVENDESDIHGDYIIQSISIPLALNGMMSINARKAVERI